MSARFQPPRWAARFLAWYCADDLYEEVAGDIEEVCQQRFEAAGPAAARRTYGWLVLRFFNLSTIRGREPRPASIIPFGMYKNFFRVALRQSWRHKTHTAINLLGLSLGIAACLLVGLFAQYEWGFDQQAPRMQDLYRLCEVQTFPGMASQEVALSMYPMGPTLQQDFPQVETFSRVNLWGEVVFWEDTISHRVTQVAWVDSAFLEMTGFSLIKGNAETVLAQPGSLVLTENLARRLFGRVDVVGEALALELQPGERVPVQVRGVLADIPNQSHLQFQALLSLNTVPETVQAERMNNWRNNWLVTYLRLKPGVKPETLEAGFPDYIQRYGGEQANDFYKLFLQPWNDIHLGSTGITHDYQNHQKFSRRYLQVFLLLGLFILIIATINFTNLTAARAGQRVREVGVRQAVGATRGLISLQFLAESVLFTLFAFCLALLITQAALPYFAQLSERPLSLGALARPIWLLGLPLAILGLGLLGGAYPAGIMTRMKTISSLRGIHIQPQRRVTLQQVLVVLQFAVAAATVTGTFLAVGQLRYMTQKDPGYDREQVLLLAYNSREIDAAFPVLRQAILQIPGVMGVTASGQRLGSNIHQTGFLARGEDTAVVQTTISHLLVDHDYPDFYGLEFLAGRTFDAGRQEDSVRAFVINEALARELGWDDPIGKEVRLERVDSWGRVIGLVRDFHYNSLHHPINPMAMSVQDWWHEEISVRVDVEQLSSILPQMQTAWEATGTSQPFEYSFLDTHFQALYRSDTQLSEVAGIVAGLVLVVALMGLFALMAFAVEKRTKEVGVRKVLGASGQDIFWLFGRSVVVLVSLALLLALPLTWWAMDTWLAGFAFRVSHGLWPYATTTGALLLLALGTTTILATRTARANPADSLRYE